MARTRKQPDKRDATIEVSDDELTQAGMPPLPAPDQASTAYGWVGSSTASVILALVQATLPLLKGLEARLERFERRLDATARGRRRAAAHAETRPKSS